MRYCTRCILPDTRPGIVLGSDGVCSACAAHARKPAIDWAARREAFASVVERAKARGKAYDCIIPVSGGKDSTWQVVECLNAGLHALAVTWKAPARTALGARNLANLVGLGVDHVDYQVNPKVERRFLYQSLVRHGSTAIPMHMALFSIPLRLAVALDVPLVVWGENSAFEYAGRDDERAGFRMDEGWRKEYGVTQGTGAGDWISPELSKADLTPYFAPSDRELEEKGVLAVFLGYYLGWDPVRSLEVAQRHGFQSRAEGPKTGFYDYADIDDDFISIHHWLKWYKFGFTRLHDNLSLEIRNGRLSREEALEIVRTRGDQTPRQDIERFCAFLGITQAHFFEVAERHRNPRVWSRRDGAWQLASPLFAGAATP